MSTKRKIHSANFKAKVALDAYKADKTSAFLLGKNNQIIMLALTTRLTPACILVNNSG